MMMMTIWWSKATRLLEFSRSSVNRTLRPEKRDTFCVTDGQADGQAEELGILVVGFIGYLQYLGAEV